MEEIYYIDLYDIDVETLNLLSRAVFYISTEIWCDICKALMPTLKNLYERRKGIVPMQSTEQRLRVECSYISAAVIDLENGKLTGTQVVMLDYILNNAVKEGFLTVESFEKLEKLRRQLARILES